MQPTIPFEVPFPPRDAGDARVRLRFMLANPVDPELLTLIARSITTVWTRLRGTELDFEVLVTHGVRFQDGSEEVWPTSYRVGRNRIVVGLDQLQRWADMMGITMESALVIAVSHEATHAVQDAEGRMPRTAAEAQAYEEGYLGHPCEIEAWDTSLDVLKAFRPQAEAVFDAGHGVRHVIPEVSRFQRTWDECVFGWEITDRLPSEYRRVMPAGAERLERMLQDAEQAAAPQSEQQKPQRRGLFRRTRRG